MRTWAAAAAVALSKTQCLAGTYRKQPQLRCDCPGAGTVEWLLSFQSKNSEYAMGLRHEGHGCLLAPDALLVPLRRKTSLHPHASPQPLGTIFPLSRVTLLFRYILTFRRSLGSQFTNCFALNVQMDTEQKHCRDFRGKCQLLKHFQHTLAKESC